MGFLVTIAISEEDSPSATEQSHILSGAVLSVSLNPEADTLKDQIQFRRISKWTPGVIKALLPKGTSPEERKFLNQFYFFFLYASPGNVWASDHLHSDLDDFLDSEREKYKWSYREALEFLRYARKTNRVLYADDQFYITLLPKDSMPPETWSFMGDPSKKLLRKISVTPHTSVLFPKDMTDFPETPGEVHRALSRILHLADRSEPIDLVSHIAVVFSKNPPLKSLLTALTALREGPPVLKENISPRFFQLLRAAATSVMPLQSRGYILPLRDNVTQSTTAILLPLVGPEWQETAKAVANAVAPPKKRGRPTRESIAPLSEMDVTRKDQKMFPKTHGLFLGAEFEFYLPGAPVSSDWTQWRLLPSEKEREWFRRAIAIYPHKHSISNQYLSRIPAVAFIPPIGFFFAELIEQPNQHYEIRLLRKPTRLWSLESLLNTLLKGNRQTQEVLNSHWDEIEEAIAAATETKQFSSPLPEDLLNKLLETADLYSSQVTVLSEEWGTIREPVYVFLTKNTDRQKVDPSKKILVATVTSDVPKRSKLRPLDTYEDDTSLGRALKSNQEGPFVELPPKGVVSPNLWEIKNDLSLGELGIEVVSPPLPPEAFFPSLEKMLEFIRENGLTTDRCGLHINISFPGIKDINLLKALLLLDDQAFLKKFPERIHSQWATAVRHTVETISRKLAATIVLPEDGVASIFKNRQALNEIEREAANIILEYFSGKHYGVNFSKLESPTPYIEIRYLGGSGYEFESKEVRNTIGRVVTTFAACLPGVERGQAEYFRKLWNLLTEVQIQISPLRGPKRDPLRLPLRQRITRSLNNT